MKIKKARKTKNLVEKKDRKIGLIFNPVIRGLQILLTVMLSYYLIFASVVFIVPSLCDLIYSMNDMAAVDNIAALLAVWGFPCLMCVGFLFIADLAIIKFLARKLQSYADSLIADYKVKQEKIVAGAESKIE